MSNRSKLTTMVGLTIAGCCLVLSGCTVTPPEIEGYVVDVKDGEFLVSSCKLADGKLTIGEAIWFSSKPREVKIGHRVLVWTSEVAESYPAQADAEKCEIVAANKPKGALFDGAEAVRRAVEERKMDGVPYIAEVKYDEDTQTWKILFAGGPERKLDAQPVLIPCRDEVKK